jgi:hypothetical protein
MAPWIFLLFAAVFNFGFYAYALISVENAARVGAMYTSSSPSAAADTAGACLQALEELRFLPNVGAAVTTCGSPPVQVTAECWGSGAACSGPGTVCAEGVATADCTRVSVTYTSVPLFAIPGLMNQLVLTRMVEARVSQP